jgi:hypothetical protein
MTVIYKEIPNIFQTQEIKFQKDHGNGKKTHAQNKPFSYSTAVLSHRSLHPPGHPVAAAVLKAPVKETRCINDFCKKQSNEVLLQC